MLYFRDGLELAGHLVMTLLQETTWPPLRSYGKELFDLVEFYCGDGLEMASSCNMGEETIHGYCLCNPRYRDHLISRVVLGR